MAARTAAFRSLRPFHAALLASVSALTLFAAGGAADARPLGGAPAFSATTAAVDTATAGSQQAAAIAQQAQNALSRAAQAVQSVQALQSAARAAAQASASSVPNGLTAGGLVVDPRVTAGTDAKLWQNISLPTQTTGAGQTTVTLTQTSQRAIATWEQFNVGKNTIVDFDQSGGNTSNGNSWIVLNRIDATGSPSHILGQIKADGTVLIINPNGIVFTGTSQINVHTLIAVAGDINSYGGSGTTNVGALNSSGDYVQVGTTAGGAAALAPANEDNANTAFINSGLYINGSSSGGTLVLSASAAAGLNVGVQVEAGAVISTVSGVSGFDNGGYVLLAGPQVSNAGSIATAAGQIILAAANAVYVTKPATGSTATSFTVLDPTLATLSQGNSQALAFPPPTVSGGSAVKNDVSGLLSSTRGAITLLGDEVEQLGVVEATTSITRAGAITIATADTTTFGPGSLTAILPDENGETIPTTSVSAFAPPSIAIATTNMDMQSGALILAPGATMNVTGTPGQSGAPLGRALLETGSEIDLAGLIATRSAADYLYTFKVTANDVADTPLAKNLIGQTVTIDLALSGARSDGESWVGSPLFASSGAGYLGDIPQSLDQLLTKGGKLTIATFLDVLSAKGSTVDVSGGYIQFTGATIDTTRLAGANGGLYDIGSANPFIAYSGVAGEFVVQHVINGQVDAALNDIYTDPLLAHGYYEPGYIDGVSAGGVSVTATNPVLEGDLVGDIVIGSQQRLLAQAATGTGGAQTTPDQLPTGAALAINLARANSSGLPDAIVLDSTAPDYLDAGFSLGSNLNLDNTGAAANPQYSLTYSTSTLSADQLGSISIKGAYELSMAEGASLSVLSGGSITLTGVTTLDGTLTAHAGKITLTGDTPSAGAGAPPVAAVTIGPDALLDVSGLWVNDAGLSGDALQGAAFINGGSASISTVCESTYQSVGTVSNGGGGSDLVANAADATQSIVLAKGSVIDLESGGYISVAGKLKTGADGLPAGAGGSLSLLLYTGVGFAAYSSYDANLNGHSGYVFAADPSTATDYVALTPTPPNGLTASVAFDGAIYAGALNKGGAFTLQASTITIDGAATAIAPGAAVGAITLPTAFFNSGFSSYSLTSIYGGVDLTAGTTLTLKQQNYRLSGAALPATGAELRDFASLGYSADGLRQPVSLSLSQGSLGDGVVDVATAGIVIPQGAAIVADPQADIALNAIGAITVDGAIVAPAGAIAFNQSSSFTASGLDIWIGQDAVLDVDGVYVPNPLVAAYATGGVLHAGAITLGGAGPIIVLDGARFDLAGASATIEQPIGGLAGARFAAQPIWSDGGTLTFTGGSLYFGGTIDAAGGAPLATGGTLNLGAIGAINNVTTVLAYNDIVIAESGDMAAAFAGRTAPATQADLKTLTAGMSGGAAFVTADTLNASGLDSVSLTGAIAFTGNVAVDLPAALYLNGAITLLPAGITPTSPASAYASTTTPSHINTIGATQVTLSAGYIRFLNGVVAKPTLADGTLTLDASAEIDLAGVPVVSNAAQVNLISGGDISFLNNYDPAVSVYLYGAGYAAASGTALTSSGYGGLPSIGALLVADNLTLAAREIYPAADTAFLLMSLGLDLRASTPTAPVNAIAFKSNGAAPVAPLSAGGAILVDAPNIVQGGALYAPLGTIQLGYGGSQTLPAMFIGNAADSSGNAYDPVGDVYLGLLSNAGISTVASQNVTLAPGSLTSVSAAGLDIPYGTTVDGANWSDGSVVLNGPPAKLIVLGGASIVTQAGATIDASGGGDVYATEFVAGTGGSRDVLSQYNTTYVDGVSVTTPLYPDARQIYALVPSYEAKVAPYDPTSRETVALGSAVTLVGGDGIAAGTYTLLPASYATLPGAYRVVAMSTNTGAAAAATVAADGSIMMTGQLANAVTGARSSSTAMFEIQPNSTWTKYSEIDVASGDSYFAKLAATNGAATPRLASDAGQLAVAAANQLVLDATNAFAPATGGRAGEVDITGANIVVAASDQLSNFGTASSDGFAASSAYAGYLVLDADQISDLGAGSVLIGGLRSQAAGGTLITATALNLEVDSDAAHPLTGAELLLVSLAPTSASSSIHGLMVDAGSVIAAKGAVAAGSDSALIFGVNPVAQYNSTTGALTAYSAGVSGDGALLRVSNGSMVTVTRNFVPGVYKPPATNPTATGPASATPLGSLAIGADVSISGNALTFDSSGATTIAADEVLSAKNFDLAANIVNLGGGGGSGGLVVSPRLIASFAGADAVTLRSASAFNLYGDNSFGAAANPIGALTFDGSGFYSDGGTIAIAATNVAFVDSQMTANAAGANLSGVGGSLVVDASGAVTFGAGAKTLSGFAQASFAAGSQVLFTGSGSLDAKAAAVTLAGPAVVADDGAVQSLTTKGALDLAAAAGQAPTLAASDIGGALTLTGGSVAVGANLAAQSGKLILEATSGDLTLASTASLQARGTEIALFDLTEATPGGTIKLISDNGAVTLASGSLVDVSAVGAGYAGALSISAKTVARLDGALDGAAASNALGGSFVLNAGSLAGALPLAGFTGSFEVALGHGDITIASGQTLTSASVLLQADGGSVNVYGVVDASGAAGGTISLFGVKGVDVEGSLLAVGASPTELGGTVEIGTSGVFVPTGAASDYNSAYGYENISAANSGTITIGANAVIDVSGGVSEGLSGGAILIRAPLLEDGGVNVDIAPTAAFRGSRATTLEAYAVWSTADNAAITGAAKHFDGIVDPAGWYDASGALVAGSFYDVNGNDVADYSGGALTNNDGTSNALSYYLTNDYFTPSLNADGVTSGNADHQTFYGYVDDNPASGAGALMGFVETPGFKSVANTGGIANFHEVAGVELDNPTSANVNGGNISVLTNWNLGAEDASGKLLYRINGQAPILTIRAGGNVAVNASITDGFTQKTAVGTTVTVQGDTYSGAYASYTNNYTPYDWSTVNVGDLPFDEAANTEVAPVSGLSSNDVYYYDYDQAGNAYGYTGSYGTFYSLLDANYYGVRYGSSGQTLAQAASYGSADAQNAIAYLNQAQTIYSQIATATSATQKLNLYINYLNAFSNYQSSFTNYAQAWNIDSSGNKVRNAVKATLPIAPEPPPPVSVPAGTVSTAQVNNTPAPVAESSNQSPIAAMDLASEASSASYRFVAGAVFDSANPLAVKSDGTGDVAIDGHIAYANTITIPGLYAAATIDVPTIVRTGTGSIDIAAAGNFELLDATTPGVVYTAGTVAANANDFTAPTTGASGNGLTTAPAWANGGGNVAITAGRDIIGIETPVDGDGSQTGGVGVSTGQFWSAWYFTDGTAVGAATPFNSAEGGIQYSAWINYGTFFQGIGALGGGNVTLKAANNIADISASLPETIQLSGGTSLGDPPVAHYYGGGNLLVQAGDNLYSGVFYVGRGTGLIQAGGAAVADPSNPVTGLPTRVATTYHYDNGPTITDPTTGQTTYTAVPLLLAAQDGFITVEARGSIALGGVFEPTRIPYATVDIETGTLPNGFGAGFDSYGADSGVALTALAGSVTINTLTPSNNGYGVTGTLFSSGLWLSNWAPWQTRQYGAVTSPANLMVEAVSGDIAIANDISLFPSSDGALTLAAGGSISTLAANPANPTNIITHQVAMLDADNGAVESILGIPTPSALSSALHADDDAPAIIYAGEDITGAFSLIKPAKIEAGRDILNTVFTGENLRSTDVTSVIAGRDIIAESTTDNYGNANSGDVTLTLYGPGDFLVAAGRNLGPFTTAGSGGGVFAVGDGSNSSCGSACTIPYLPIAGADVTALFGVGGGVDYTAAISDYVNPANAGTGGIDYLVDIASILGESPSQAWTTFQALSPARQKLLVDRAFLDFLTQVGLDYNNPASAYYDKYARAYDAIATLFPASLGYTDNGAGGANGASVTVHTGDLTMARSLIETQTGGDIDILGPGGSATIGANAADPLVASPSKEGILTLQGGSIRTYTDGSVEIYQSRVFTEQGGDVDMFSANGDLNAGKGKKSSAAYPPLRLICDTDGYCRVSPAGLVTGAGIGALLSVPGQDPKKSNVNLTTPHGTVDAGAAGIRVAGNLNIVAALVLNSFNIQVGGTAIGVPTAATADIGALTTASNAAGAAAKSAEAPTQSQNADQPSIIMVEILGFGGGDGTPPAQQDDRDKKRDRSSQDDRYDPTSTFRVIGSGELTDEQKSELTEEERSHL